MRVCTAEMDSAAALVSGGGALTLVLQAGSLPAPAVSLLGGLLAGVVLPAPPTAVPVPTQRATL